ncbi:MAG TPA: N-acyl homoserine lactonase family protein, partial [Gemmatimonadales bacterium]|nr:N-acyl homoserine lactonase family protein [Gemmatimonadales bacterium]
GMRTYLFLVFSLLLTPHASLTAQGPTWQVAAVRYATIKDFPVVALVKDADTTRRLDIAMMVWVLRGSGRTVLVDAGFHREKFVTQWKPADFVTPAEAVAEAGVKPESVTDIIISHIHWDHADGIDLFPKARVWIQKAEYEHYVGPNGEPLDAPTITPEVAGVLAAMRRAGKLTLVDGDNREIIPGIRVYTGGKHTWESQYAGVKTKSGTVVIASDNMYLYENLEKRAPIAQTLDIVSNLKAQDRMRTIASKPELIIPGHDALVFTKFPSKGRVATIR